MKNKLLLISFSMLILLLTSGCQEKTVELGEEKKDVLYQVSTLNALIEGNFKGSETINNLKENGDFGIGTFDSLDGELVMLEGEVYQVKYTGEVLKVENDMKVPFAAVTNFEKDINKELMNISDYNELIKELDGMINNKELFYAFKIDGSFDYIKTRSVPPQEEPYPLLSEVTKKQPVFEYENVEGSLVGFWCPDYVGQINVPGYHLHFISTDKTMGGHLLEVSFDQGYAYADITADFKMEIPEDINSAELLDPEAEIEKVEK